MNMRPQKINQILNPSPLSKKINNLALKIKDTEKVFAKGYLAYDGKTQSILKKFYR